MAPGPLIRRPHAVSVRVRGAAYTRSPDAQARRARAGTMRILVRVMLFDHALDGHHIQYGSHLISHLVESGDEVSFVTPTESLLLDRIRDQWPDVTVKPLSAQPRETQGAL